MRPHEGHEASAVEVLGLPVAALADAASKDDTVLVGRLLDEHAPKLPRLELVMGDQGLRNLAHRAARDQVVFFKAPLLGGMSRGWLQAGPAMWRVEETFARLGAWRRLSPLLRGLGVRSDSLAAARLRRSVVRPAALTLFSPADGECCCRTPSAQ